MKKRRRKKSPGSPTVVAPEIAPQTPMLIPAPPIQRSGPRGLSPLLAYRKAAFEKEEEAAFEYYISRLEAETLSVETEHKAWLDGMDFEC